jgi:hypothetical protein
MLHGQAASSSCRNVRPGFLLLHGRPTRHHLPVGAQFGIPIDPKVTINAVLRHSVLVTFGTFSSFHMPLLFGGGVEYLLEPNLALTFKLRLGPDIGSVTSRHELRLQRAVRGCVQALDLRR